MQLKLKNIICVVAFLWISVFAYAQTAKAEYVGRADMAKVFKQINSWFLNTPTYTLMVTHTSFEDYKTIVPADKSVGYFKKDRNNYHSFLLGIHTIQNKKYKVVVDSSQKIIIIANPDQLIWNNYTLNEYDTILKMCSTIKVIEKNSDKLYRIEFDQENPLSGYEFFVSTEGILKEMVWYSNQEIKKKPADASSETSKPRVHTVFSNYNTAPQLKYQSEFDETVYFINRNNKPIVTDRYKSYRLLDQRFNKN